MEKKREKPLSPDIKRRLAKLSGREYGFLRTLAEHSFLDLNPVERLLSDAVMDRLTLAQRYLAFARGLALDSEFHGRQMISRGYYAMHHAARAVIFATRRGNITSHEGVIKEIGRTLGQGPADLLARQLGLRNDVEYEVYLRFDVIRLAEESLVVATEFIENCAAYLARR